MAKHTGAYRLRFVVQSLFLMAILFSATGCSLLNKLFGRSESSQPVRYVTQTVQAPPRFECGQPSITAVRRNREAVFETQYVVRDDTGTSRPLSINEQFSITINKETADRVRSRNSEHSGSTIRSKITMPLPDKTSLALTFGYSARNQNGRVCNASNSIYIPR